MDKKLTKRHINQLVIVTPFDKKIIEEIKKYTLIIRTDNTQDIPLIIEYSKKQNLNIQSIILDYKDFSLDLISFSSKWEKYPITIYIKKLGSKKSLFTEINTLRKLNIKIFLPADITDSYDSLHILGSLHINCGLYFNKKNIIWREFESLMNYTLFNKLALPPIEPFSYIKNNYNPSKLINILNITFNNPERFIHVNNRGQIALTSYDLVNQTFISEDIRDIHIIKDNKLYIKEIQRHQNIFIDLNTCSTCPAWRICSGSFSHLTEKNKTCRPTLTKLITSIEKTLKNKNIAIKWQH